MAAIWKGSLTFGLVNIPVELKTAVRADHISFRLLHEEDLSPVKYERVCQADGETVPWNEIVKGYEYEKGKFVVLTGADFKTAALEEGSGKKGAVCAKRKAVAAGRKSAKPKKRQTA